MFGHRNRPAPASLLGLAFAVFLLLRSEPTRAQTYVAGGARRPDFVWLKIGFTSEYRFFFGASFEAALASVDVVSWTAGVEISPRSEIAFARLFTTMNATTGTALLTSDCNAVLVGASGGPVFTIGPRNNHVGLRLGARLAVVPMAFPSGSEPALGFSYGFSRLSTVAHVHDFAADFGQTWGAHGDCESD